ncbi:MAG: 30S ribosomal protein S20 [Pseudomonadota bacterium]
MANTTSAKKMIRKIERRTAVNKSRRSRVRTFLRSIDEAIAAGDKAAADAAFKAAMPEMHRAASKGVFHKATVARKLSRLSSRIKAIDAAQ